MKEINLEKLQKLWNHATKNANQHEASTAALMFTKMIAKHGLKVHLYSGQAPATEQQIRDAIDKAYIKGQMETKEQYKRIIEHQKSQIYNEGYRDGKSDSYTKDDMNREYNKGFAAGIREGSIEKAQPSRLASHIAAYPDSSGNVLVSNAGSTNSLYYLSNATASTSFTIKCSGL